MLPKFSWVQRYRGKDVILDIQVRFQHKKFLSVYNSCANARPTKGFWVTNVHQPQDTLNIKQLQQENCQPTVCYMSIEPVRTPGYHYYPFSPEFNIYVLKYDVHLCKPALLNRADVAAPAAVGGRELRLHRRRHLVQALGPPAQMEPATYSNQPVFGWKYNLTNRLLQFHFQTHLCWTWQDRQTLHRHNSISAQQLGLPQCKI